VEDEARETGRRKRGGRGPGVALPGLRRERIRSELTVRDLARKAGVDPSTISLVENGRRGAQEITVEKIARALETDAELLRRDREAGGREAAEGAARDLFALARLWAAREGISEDEAVRRIRAERDRPGASFGGRGSIGLPSDERVVLASGDRDAASAAVSAVRGG
jgi:transcriptional regulator with XRE-family HTH domain